MSKRAFNRTDPAGNTASFKQTLQRLGADKYDLALPESHSIGKLLDKGDVIEGVVFGRYRRSSGLPGRGMLAATDRRVIFFDRKPFSFTANEISYNVISGVSYGATGLVSTIVLNTRVGDVSMRTFNPHTPALFVGAIEAHIFKQPADFRPIAPRSP